RGVSALSFLDGDSTTQSAGAGKGVEGGGKRRERVGLVHHHCNYKFSRHLNLPAMQTLEQPIEMRSAPMCQQCCGPRNPASHHLVRCRKATPHAQDETGLNL